jgi:S-adenosyl-L-methionine hydrolase (adenosine-forming)
VIVTFLTDFGLQDDFVGTCHGVIKRIAPSAEIIDITHGVSPQQVLQGALILANTLPYMPEGVHLAVVDPGVGTHRRPVALRGGDGRRYVGPDNGLLLPATERLGGVAEAWELTNPAYRLEPVSHTFHGRDIFAPAAAHLAAGIDPAELGPAIDPDSLVRPDLPAPEIDGRVIRAHVLIADRFGNIQLNVTAAELERIGIEPGTDVEIEVGLQQFYAVAARTFAEVRVGDIVLYEDAYGSVAVAINAGNAARMLSAKLGDGVVIRARPQRS